MVLKVCTLLKRVVIWLLLCLVSLEVASFLGITLSNYLIFGKAREGSRVVYDPYALYLNVAGVRPTRHNPPPDQAREVVWLLGGSTMRGATEDDGRTIPSLLAACLNREHPEWYLVNFGENSFNSLLETKYLQKLLIEQPLKPTRVIFYDGANDATYFVQYRRWGAHLGYRRLQALIESYHASFFGLLKPLNAAWQASFSRELFQKLRGVAAPLGPDSPELQEFAAACRQRYDHVERLAACYGADFLLVWQPLWWVETGEVHPAVQQQEQLGMIMRSQRFAAFRENVRLVNQTLVDHLQHRPYFVDCRNILTPRTEPVYQADGVHLLDAGRVMVAQTLARLLTARTPRP